MENRCGDDERGDDEDEKVGRGGDAGDDVAGGVRGLRGGPYAVRGLLPDERPYRRAAEPRGSLPTASLTAVLRHRDDPSHRPRPPRRSSGAFPLTRRHV